MTSSKRPRRYRETVDFLRMCSRMLAAAGRRTAESDPDDFRELANLERILGEVLDEAVRGMRRSQLTWQEIGDAAGVTRQAAHKRWAHKCGELQDNGRDSGRAS